VENQRLHDVTPFSLPLMERILHYRQDPVQTSENSSSRHFGE
jgi:hypothetical protein